ncbi:ribosome biogenesis/translation initiation ATPase RLI [Tardisphaera saccharovorans]
MRLAVVDDELCNSKICGIPCVTFCPVNRIGTKTVWIAENGKSRINEQTCIGCGICVHKCPFGAISIINVADYWGKKLVHRYGENGFALYGLPEVKRGFVTGIIGRNGAGKSTSLKILAGELQPNLGGNGGSLLDLFKGSELRQYFSDLGSGKLKISVKPQILTLEEDDPYMQKTVNEVISSYNDERLRSLTKEFALDLLGERRLGQLSGGELQLLTLAIALSKDADVYLIDEPSSYLDVFQRMEAAKKIRETVGRGKSGVVIEHDLIVLDYLSDYVSVVYGSPGVFGMASRSYGTRNGINNFLRGFLPDENTRLREGAIDFFDVGMGKEEVGRVIFSWEKLRKRLGDFELTSDGGEAKEGSVTALLGRNGIGKTTLVKMLAGIVEPDEGAVPTAGLRISYKPQMLRPVDMLVSDVMEAVKDSLGKDYYKTEVFESLGIDKLWNRNAKSLSGGELQKVAVALCLGRDAEVYLLDEPSAFLDVEERLRVGKAIRRVMAIRRSTGFIVDHDLLLLTSTSDSMIVFEGESGKRGHARKPVKVLDGVNHFLKEVGITMRRDPETGRPRVNKEGSILDRQQKESGAYFMISVGAEVEG